MRDGITSYGDPGWYHDPLGMARPATAEELSRDGINAEPGVATPNHSMPGMAADHEH